jgi:hypothetical protein
MHRFLLATILLLVSSTVAADIKNDLEAILPADIAAGLVVKKEQTRFSYRVTPQALKLTPRAQVANEVAQLRDIKSVPLVVENLFLYQKPEQKRAQGAADLRRISEILRSISQLTGVKYYSHTGEYKPLYSESFVSEDGTRAKKVPDPTEGSANGLSFTVYQRDSTFGETVYAYRFSETQDSVAFFAINAKPVYYKVLKLIDERNLSVSLVVQDLGDYLLVYGLTCADFFPFPGIEKQVNSSFSNRVTAIYKWFIQEYES